MLDLENLTQEWEDTWRKRDKKLNKRVRPKMRAQSHLSVAQYRGLSKTMKRRLAELKKGNGIND
jgi:hypothetical protein